ncbi:topless-related protein 4-like isoform X5 [Quercus lobata]|uniref:topless-related protein 4-like isoform X5 n=1 Tax=Quercus lobata TaxID=97700 RepID=UPI001243B93A|nr:topless-related protein 4-like isoform X5 [Quercus lobata]XP_030971099.1 topless-related protein 4-like isoform X5 [Quercus lobata]
MNGIKILAHADGYGFCFDRKASASVLQGAIIRTFGSSSSTAGTSIGVADRSALMTVMAGQNGDSRRLPDMKPNHTDELEKSNTWMLTDFNQPSQLRSLRLPDCLMPVRISRLTYTNSGGAILALGFNAVHKLWKWQANEGKATSSVPPQLWQPSNGVLMTNDMNPEDAIPCFALSKNDSYLISASGGKSSLYNMMTFERMTTFMPPPPAATFVAFYPQDNNIVAIGIDDSSIDIYNVRFDEIKSKLKGHQKRVTGLAFSNVLNILVSSGADAQWVPQESCGSVTDATYSCDSQSIYVSVEDGSVWVLTATTLQPRSRISPDAYFPSNLSSRIYPIVIAAHPSQPNQFALGLTNGGVYVIEPPESKGNWGVILPLENGAGPSFNLAADLE